MGEKCHVTLSYAIENHEKHLHLIYYVFISEWAHHMKTGMDYLKRINYKM